MALKVAGRGRIPPFIVMDVVRAAEARAAAAEARARELEAALQRLQGGA